MQITSVHNQHLLEIRRAASRGRPTSDGLIVAEGPHLVQELLESTWEVKEVVLTAEARSRHYKLLQSVRSPILELPTRTFRTLATTETTQEILAIAKPRDWTWNDLLNRPSLVVILDGIQDPGNAGTLIRSAEAFGATGVLLVSGTAQVSNGKLLRASAGSVFRVPYVWEASRDAIIDRLRGLKVYALSTRGYTELRSADLACDCAIVIGSEGAGVSEELSRHAEALYIQTRAVESLNAGVAGSIVLHEAARRRNSL